KGCISGEILDRNLLEEGYSAKTIRSGKELLRNSKSIQFNRTSEGKVILNSRVDILSTPYNEVALKL
ncbi:MAG: hypothetical protein IKD66_06905, partial [Solobacterium sp.]|nr:hypothetical protein [Solobacterium sp.]